METLAAVGLVGNIVQFVDFSEKLISKSAQLRKSDKDALPENADIETVTNHLVLLSNRLKDPATSTGDELQKLCTSCRAVAEELLAALDKVKVKGEQGKWKSIRKTLRIICSREDIENLERRLAMFREALNSHIVVDLRYCPGRLSIDCANHNCTTGTKYLSSTWNSPIASKMWTRQ